MVGIRIAAWIAIIAVIVYTIFVGAEASVVRAAVLAILMILAVTMLGRPIFLPAVLFGAAFFLTRLNPDTLRDVGFQLSFAAALGLTLYLGPYLRHLLETQLRIKSPLPHQFIPAVTSSCLE